MQHTLCPQLAHLTFCKNFNTVVGLVFKFWQQEYGSQLKKRR